MSNEVLSRFTCMAPAATVEARRGMYSYEKKASRAFRKHLSSLAVLPSTAEASAWWQERYPSIDITFYVMQRSIQDAFREASKRREATKHAATPVAAPEVHADVVEEQANGTGVELTLFRGIEFDTTNPDKPRIPAMVLARRAGSTNPSEIKRTVENNREELEEDGVLHVAVYQTVTSMPHGGTQTRTYQDYALNEMQALGLLYKMKGPVAKAFRSLVKKVFKAWLEGRVHGAPTSNEDPMIAQLEILKQQRMQFLATEAAVKRIEAKQEVQDTRIEVQDTRIDAIDNAVARVLEVTGFDGDGGERWVTATAFMKMPECVLIDGKEQPLGVEAGMVARRLGLTKKTVPHSQFDSVNRRPIPVWLEAQENLLAKHPEFRKPLPCVLRALPGGKS